MAAIFHGIVQEVWRSGGFVGYLYKTYAVASGNHGVQWRTLMAAQLGWMLDAMDVMLYSFALTTIRDEFHFSRRRRARWARLRW